MLKLQIVENKDFFGPLLPYIEDESITDIDYNGAGLWLTDVENQRYEAKDCKITKAFVEEFSNRVANVVSKPFHKQSPVLEAETETLRITIIHESIALLGRGFSIRKSLPMVRLTEENMVASGYASEAVIRFLSECVKHQRNLVFCGEPGVGKTECAKFFSQFIPENSRVITIEDTPEWHYSKIHPQADCIEMRLNPNMDYTLAIKTSLRLNPKWMMVSEVRSKEVLYLIESLSTGVRGITTLHTDDVSKIPDRMLNMMGDVGNSRLENDIYSFIDIGVLIRRKAYEDADGRVHVRRYIDQVCTFDRNHGNNSMHMLVEDGKMLWEGWCA